MTVLLFLLEGKAVVVFTIFEVMSPWSLSLHYLKMLKGGRGEDYVEFFVQKVNIVKGRKGAVFGIRLVLDYGG
jgi:hypothetical protein